MLEKARQAERLEAERSAASEKFERLRTAASVLDEIAELEQTHPSTIPLGTLRPEVERLRVVDARIRELNALLADELEVTYEAPRPPRSWPTP